MMRESHAFLEQWALSVIITIRFLGSISLSICMMRRFTTVKQCIYMIYSEYNDYRS